MSSIAFDRARASVISHRAASLMDAIKYLNENERRDEADRRWLELCAQVDPAAGIRNLTNLWRTGPEREASDELERRSGRPIESPNALRIPWETLAIRSARHAAMREATRADTVGTLTTGGYLAQTLNWTSAAQALLAMLVLGKLGATAIDAPQSANLNYPRVTTASSPYWLSTETTQITESDQVYGQAAFSPHQVGGYTEISRLLVLQSSPSGTDAVANDLARKVGREIERVAFAGTGIDGQPHGLAGMSGVNAVSGASYALATGMTAMTDTGDALTDDAFPGFAANRSVASLLRQRQEFSGSSFTLWKGGLTWGALHDVPAGSTSGIASGTAFFGCWRYLVVVDFDGGVTIEVNPFGSQSSAQGGSGGDAGNFQKGIIGMRALATLDVAPIWPAAFSAITGIT